MNRFELFDIMVSRSLVTIKGVTGTIQAISLEDGSGYCFNVCILQTNGDRRVVFVRTIKR